MASSPSASSTRSAPLAKREKGTDYVRKKIEEARSADLVFAIVAHIGSAEADVRRVLIEELTKSHEYTTHFIDTSSLITTAAKAVNNPLEEGRSRLDRTENLQHKGDWLREKYGNGIVAGLSIQEIGKIRADKADSRNSLAFIVDSLKHPDEVDVLRDVYGEAFFLISIVCSLETRVHRLKQPSKYGQDLAKNIVTAEELEKRINDIIKRDEADTTKKDFGQQVRKTLHRADYFINNSDEGKDVGPQVRRLLRIIFGLELERPNHDERGIYSAWGAAMRSACLSRQVGAAVMDASGEIVSTGTNDVPRFGGGLYPKFSEESEGIDQAKHDHRCYHSDTDIHRDQLIQISRLNSPLAGQINIEGKSAYCRNDLVKQTIYEDIFHQLQTQGLLAAEATLDSIREAIETTRVKDLVEFSRAVHAEMDALLSLTRSGGGSPVGGTLYCTTYPCHNCARHIVAAGIYEVVYIEPYPKSMALVLHSDAIEESVLPYATRTPKEENQKVRFRLFAGVAPRRYADLFEKRTEIKEKGILVKARKRHRDPSFNQSFLELEKNIAEQITKSLEKSTGSGA